MTTKERVDLVATQLLPSGTLTSKSKAILTDAIDAAVKEEREALLDAISPTLADIAFSNDMDLKMCKNKARRLYEKLRAKELAEEGQS